MELTLDQALQKGIEAHKAGKAQEADQYYTAILKANPKHPDANHNMGVLAVGIGKMETALPFFKTAVEANPNIDQYWLSYIDALIKLDRMSDAKEVFEQAKSKGTTGESFDQIEKSLTRLKMGTELKTPSKKLKDPPQDQLQILVDLCTKGELQKSVSAAEELLDKFPNSVMLLNISGLANTGLGRLDEAIGSYRKAVLINPNYADTYNNMGVVLQDLGTLDEAIEAYKKALSIKPNFADAYNNLGIALKKQGKIDGALDAYTKVVSIKPNFADAHYNMGNALKDQGKFDEAIEAYTKVLSIKPDFVQAYNNMGIALKRGGKLEGALEAYQKALSIKPDDAVAYNNMGLVLQERGKLDEAIEAYYKALSIKPDYADAYWNLCGTSRGVSEAQNWVNKCLEANSNHLQAKLTKSALQFYEGDKSEYNALLKSSFKDHPYTRSFAWAFNLPKLPPLHFHRWALFDHMISLSKKNRPFYEFGVWRGEAFRYLIKTFKKGYGFDTFEGLPEDWHNENAGTYTSDGNVPEIKDGKFIVGKFEDTLPGFFVETRPMASIINFDADLYSSTICALNYAKPVIDKHTILIFDEFIINENWEQDEYKALEEFCSNNDYTYEVLAISFFTKQVAVKVIGI